METPNDRAGWLTEEIMVRIRPHLLPDEKYQPHHYNRTWSAVYEALREHFKSPAVKEQE